MVCVVGVVFFAVSNLLRNSTQEYENNFTQEKPLKQLQNSDFKNEKLLNEQIFIEEKLEYLDKNISEILHLNKTEANATILDVNVSFKNNEHNLSDDNQSYQNIKQNTSKQDIIVIAPDKKQNNSIEQNNTNSKLHFKKSNKARLAIIIDDMASYTHVKMLKETNLKLTPSFFPPDKSHPLTPKFAKEFDFFMVHLPLAAIKYDKAELNTLNPKDSSKDILKRVEFIKEHFPNLKFINNHTGSLFTSDENAMQNLFKAFDENDLIFVDSRTIGSSKAKKLANFYRQPYIARDVFLDNEDNVEYIQNQIQKAIKEAKDKGFAIAIGHPKKNTFKALVLSKELLNSVELVYLSEVYE